MYSWNVGAKKKRKDYLGGLRSNLAHIARYATRRTRRGWGKETKAQSNGQRQRSIAYERRGNTDNGMLQDRGRGGMYRGEGE
ncbi:hypothetical protein ASPTUDRAFT_642701 [Aspergillus tubingensis CBS 134.48]|uniref:Uncharacterized protein n=1 Tax=Aspergillus tubingensis (strain CBS 134.48) TaxID=767770 RepID=A0A1L9N4H0_ASPTC|nr:hypothetical protein ASPTUDRAFT_642701 [Aspergillus tubingensis CBS 134.48]